jgi:hypothetical protein|tara:strand:- start:380 stop:709 length:330 start_codon:yes stop_codon:yes gene_type:complete
MNCLVLGLALSMHVGLENNYNQVHPYVMCEQNQVTTGIYHNSLDRISVVLAKEFDLIDDLTLDVGIVSGYVYDVVPMIRLKYKNLFLMPALEDDRTGLVFGYQYEFNFK